MKANDKINKYKYFSPFLENGTTRKVFEHTGKTNFNKSSEHEISIA